MSAYYNGKKFDTIEEMINFAQKHSSSCVTLPDLEEMMKQMGQTIWMNLCTYDIQMTNAQIRTYLERNMLTLISLLVNKHTSEKE